LRRYIERYEKGILYLGEGGQLAEEGKMAQGNVWKRESEIPENRDEAHVGRTAGERRRCSIIIISCWFGGKRERAGILTVFKKDSA